MKGTIVVLLIVLTLVAVLLVIPQFQGYGIRTLPGRAEYLSEPQPETVGYVARPPTEMGRQLLSPSVSEQSKESAWGNARGKWVLWKGEVHSVEPALNPSRIVLVYDYEAPMPLYTQSFAVVVEFDAKQSERLKQLKAQEIVYFRAKLMEKEYRLADVYRYGLDFSSHVLLLEKGQIVDPDDIAAALVDLAHEGYEQLDALVKEADGIAAVSGFFEGKLTDGKKRIAIETMTKLVGIDIGDKYWLLTERPMVELRAHRDYLRFGIEQRLKEALEVLHHAGPLTDVALRQAINQQARSNDTMVEATKDAGRILRGFWEEERQSAQPGISDLALESLLLRLPATIGVAKTIMEGIVEYGKLDVYETIVGTCHIQLDVIEEYMEHIHGGIIETSRIVVQRAELRQWYS